MLVSKADMATWQRVHNEITDTEGVVTAMHEWVKSTLGHGDAMCRRCCITNREAAVLGLLNRCDKAPAAPESDDARFAAAKLDMEIDDLIEEARRGNQEDTYRCMAVAQTLCDLPLDRAIRVLRMSLSTAERVAAQRVSL